VLFIPIPMLFYMTLIVTRTQLVDSVTRGIFYEIDAEQAARVVKRVAGPWQWFGLYRRIPDGEWRCRNQAELDFFKRYGVLFEDFIGPPVCRRACTWQLDPVTCRYDRGYLELWFPFGESPSPSSSSSSSSSSVSVVGATEKEEDEEEDEEEGREGSDGAFVVPVVTRKSSRWSRWEGGWKRTKKWFRWWLFAGTNVIRSFTGPIRLAILFLLSLLSVIFDESQGEVQIIVMGSLLSLNLATLLFVQPYSANQDQAADAISALLETSGLWILFAITWVSTKWGNDVDELSAHASLVSTLGVAMMLTLSLGLALSIVLQIKDNVGSALEIGHSVKRFFRERRERHQREKRRVHKKSLLERGRTNEEWSLENRVETWSSAHESAMTREPSGAHSVTPQSKEGSDHGDDHSDDHGALDVEDAGHLLHSMNPVILGKKYSNRWMNAVLGRPFHGWPKLGPWTPEEEDHALGKIAALRAVTYRGYRTEAQLLARMRAAREKESLIESRRERFRRRKAELLVTLVNLGNWLADALAFFRRRLPYSLRRRRWKRGAGGSSQVSPVSQDEATEPSNAVKTNWFAKLWAQRPKWIMGGSAKVIDNGGREKEQGEEEEQVQRGNGLDKLEPPSSPSSPLPPLRVVRRDRTDGRRDDDA